jgi:transcriptional regulator with XRE-family HTH domain
MKKVIGKKIRIFRKMNDLTLEDVSHEVNISYQQIQKYETGDSSISAEMLFKFSQLFNTPIENFFHEITHPSQVFIKEQSKDFIHRNLVNEDEKKSLLEHFCKIHSKDVRLQIIQLLKSFTAE